MTHVVPFYIKIRKKLGFNFTLSRVKFTLSASFSYGGSTCNSENFLLS